MTVELERIEKRFMSIDGPPSIADLDLYQRTAGNLRRLLESLGIRRRPRERDPHLREYLEEVSP